MELELKTHKLRHLSFQGAAPARASRPVVMSASVRSLLHAAARRHAPDLLTPESDSFLLWILRRAGLVPEHYRASPLRRRLPACLRLLHAPDFIAARKMIEQRPVLLNAALDTLLIGVTEFFRDPGVFDTLRYHLAATQRAPLRVWSVSCSVGCELYSVAILMSELGLMTGGFLLGTDCRSEPLAYAQRGIYPEIYLQKLAPNLRSRYFLPAEVGARVREPLRSHVHWRQQDICAIPDAPASELWDVILWRNTAIYLNPTTAMAVWQRLVQQLRPGGLLISGKAERPPSRLPLQRLDTCVHCRVSP